MDVHQMNVDYIGRGAPSYGLAKSASYVYIMEYTHLVSLVSKAPSDPDGQCHWCQLSTSPLGHNEGVTIMRSHQWSEMTLRDRHWSECHQDYTSTGGWGIGSPGLNPATQHSGRV